jgi:hypothetical protein
VDVARTQTDAPPDVNPPDSPPRSAVALTERVVAARLATRAAKIKAECAVPWLVLDLVIERGQATLATINGMPFTEADPIHTCVRTQIRGLRLSMYKTQQGQIAPRPGRSLRCSANCKPVVAPANRGARRAAASARRHRGVHADDDAAHGRLDDAGDAMGLVSAELQRSVAEKDE